MKVAVTGATGFIGRYVLGELAERKDVEIIAAARQENGAAKLPIDCTYVQIDLSRPSPTTFAELGSPDVLIHLAWSGLPNFKAIHHFDPQLFEQYRFLSTLVRAGLQSVLCTGTCLEYGMQDGELSEDLVSDPMNPYALAKDTLRRSLLQLQASIPFALTWARLFYMYGEGQAPTSLYAQLMAAIRNGEKSFKMSKGEQLRDFLPVREVARILVKVALEAPNSSTVNVCSGEPVSVRRMVEKWLDENHCSMKLELGHYSYPDYEPLAFWGSPRHLMRCLGEID